MNLISNLTKRVYELEKTVQLYKISLMTRKGRRTLDFSYIELVTKKKLYAETCSKTWLTQQSLQIVFSSSTNRSVSAGVSFLKHLLQFFNACSIKSFKYVVYNVIHKLLSNSGDLHHPMPEFCKVPKKF